MKKTLVALAALAASASFAQSSVTISGRMDLGHASIKTTGTVGGVPVGTAKTFSLAGDQHGRTTSRLTFSGSEDLGGGLRANFNYETRLNPDLVAGPSGFDRTRNMFLNLSGGFGGVTIGTYLNAVDTLRGYSAATYSAPGGDFLANHGGMSGRSTNAIAYSTPNLSGFTAAVGLVSEKATVANGAGVLTAQGKINGNSLSASYNNGPLSAHAVTTSAKGSGLVVTGKTSTQGIAVSYDLGMAKPYFQYEAGKAQADVSVNTYSKYNAFEIGATFPLGAFTPYVTFGSGKLKDTVAGVAVGSDKTSAFQLGTTYALSKRTSVYGAIGSFKVSESLGPVAAQATVKTTGYKFGLIHNF